MKVTLAVLVCLVACTSICQAAIEKNAVPSPEGLKLYWWPKADPPLGFDFDEAASHRSATKMFVLHGSTYADAETVIYARAVYKPREPAIKSLQALIESDQAESRSHSPELKIHAQPALVDRDGKRLPVVSFTPAGAGNWEWVAYGEEGDFYLIFAISSRSRKGFDAALPAFKAMIGAYRENP